VDFLLVLIELFPLGVTAEALRANIGSKPAISLQRGPVDPKFPVEGIAPTNHSSYQKIRLNDLSYGIKIWIDHSSILSQITRFSDKQTGWLRSTVAVGCVAQLSERRSLAGELTLSCARPAADG